MGLKERLLALAAGDGNTGNTAEEARVTEKTVTEQGGNTGNPGNTDFGEGEHETAEMGTPGGENTLTRPLLSRVTRATGVTSLKTRAESGNTTTDARVTGVTGRLVPSAPVALGPDDPGDEGLEWQGEAEDVPARKGEPDWWRPRPLPEGTLHARLVAAGATINTYGKCASVRAPAGIPAELLHEVEARGWRIIPGGRANPEAEHDSWLAGVPIAELER